jgi:glycosyltransferase involved in cell wall biosynthesis
MRVALVYDRVNKWGGAERVLLALHELFPDAPLFTSVYDQEKASWAKVFEETGQKIKTSFLQRFTFARGSHEFFASVMPVAFESFDFNEYDVVISVTSEFAKSIITKPETRHISIILTPTRYLWSGYDHYFKNKMLRAVSLPVVRYLRSVDKTVAHRPDELIGISKEVQDRIKKYYGRSSVLVYPPVDVHTIKNKKQSTEHLVSHSYFLVVSRLVSYKKIDIAIEAANELKIPLIIIGEGRDKQRLQKIAGTTITFAGFVSEEQLVEYYRRAQALIFPGEEDFGIVMVEAQLHGLPVIAYNAGGAKEIVIAGKTGELFDKQNEESLVKILKNFDKTRYNSKSSIANAQRFSKENFKKSIKAVIDKKNK